MKYIFSFLIFFNFIYSSYSTTLVSHKGYYDLNLKGKNAASFLEGGNGKSTYFFQKTCEGWSHKENFFISYNLTNKKSAKTYSMFKSFEDFSSKNFSFEHLDKSDLNGEINYSGFVKKTTNKLLGKLIDRDIKNINYTDKILLPTEHMLKLIKFAKENKPFFNSNVFFGSSKDNLVKKISAFIGKKKLSSTNLNSRMLNKKVWPIKLAFYNYKQKKASPETEISLEVDEEGIVHKYNVDYGEYEMSGILEKIETFKETKC